MTFDGNSQPAPSDISMGDVFAERYQVNKVLGAGPYSTVYRARDVLTNEAVALKLVRAPGLSNEAISQYRLELNLFRQIQHPALVHISDFGEYLGRLYVTMELIQGFTLRNYLRVIPHVPIDEFSTWFSDLCDALILLHAQNVIHRDIHPSNIMITSSGGCKLMDFGLGRDLRKSVETPDDAYAAPEQLNGQKPSCATDVYGLGAISYKILTHRDPRVKSALESIFGPSEIDSAPGFSRFLDTCLHADPSKRFQNAPAMKLAGLSILKSQSGTAGARKLEDLKTQAPPVPADMLPIFSRIVTALIRLHASGKKHVALSPKSITVGADTAEFDTDSRQTATGSDALTLFIADPKYTAPELITARTAPDSPGHISADIYVLGFIFYELLVGRQEMEGQFEGVERMPNTLAWVSWHADPKKKLRPLREAAPQCPQPLADVIERMIAKDPGQRIKTLEDVAASLEKLKSRLAVTERGSAGAEPANSASRRPRTRSALVAVFTILLIALAGAAWWLNSAGWQPVSRFSAKWAHFLPWSGGVRSGDTRAVEPVVETSTGEMMLVPEGAFQMGSDSAPDEQPVHNVTLPAYYIDRLEVSNGAYRSFCSRTGRVRPQPPAWDPDYGSKDDCPVLNVTRDDAASFCVSAGKRLPTEEEWEKAARGSDEPGIIWGNWTLPGLSNLRSSGQERPSAGGSFRSDVSPYGVLDLAGNVQEWVGGDYKPYSGSPLSNVSLANAQGIVRGGSFSAYPQHLSPAWRGAMPVDGHGTDLSSVGFRCAADATAGAALSLATNHSGGSRGAGGRNDAASERALAAMHRLTTAGL